MDLSGQTALITGASSGMGLAIAEAWATAGMNLAITARRAELLDIVAGTARVHGGRLIPGPRAERQALRFTAEETIVQACTGRADLGHPHAGAMQGIDEERCAAAGGCARAGAQKQQGAG